MATSVAEMFSAKMNEKRYIKNGFATSIMSNLHALWRKGEFCDIVLNVDNRDFNVHKVVLVSSSPYFDAMFRGNMSEKFQDKVSEEITNDFWKYNFKIQLLDDFCNYAHLLLILSTQDDFKECVALKWVSQTYYELSWYLSTLKSSYKSMA